MNRVGVVVFDIDGTLLDTSEYIYQAFEHVLNKHGYPVRDRKDIASQIGKKIEECYAYLSGESEFADLIESHNDFQTANLALIKAFNNVEDLVKNIKTSGIKVGLWTGRNHLVEESLESGGLNVEMFDCLITPNMTKKGKPDPEGLLLTLGKLGIEPSEALMVGDSSLDILAGKNAEVLATIGITHGFGSKNELKAANADYIIDSIDKLLEIVDNLNK